MTLAITPGNAVHIHILSASGIPAYTIRPERLYERLRSLTGAHRLNVQVTTSRDATEVTPEMQRATVLVGYRFPHHRLEEMPELRWIHLTSAGVEHLLPLDWLPPRLLLTNSSGVHAQLGGEYACCALLMLNVGVPKHIANQKVGHWDQVFNVPIAGKTAVIIGVGAIGGAAATHAKRLGLRVLGVRRSCRPHRHVDEMFGPEDLAKILPRADFVVVTAPLTPETRGMIGAKELDLLHRDAGVVNMSRAGLVDYDALGEKLRREELRGAIIDVTDPEPLPPESPLWHVHHLLITPHISSDPANYAERVMDILIDNLGRLVAGKRVRNRVSRARGY